MKHLDFKMLGGTLVVWKLGDPSQSFEVARGPNGEESPQHIEGDFFPEELEYGKSLWRNSSCRYV